MLFLIKYSYGQNPNDITFYTEHFPPFNYEENGVLHGIAVDILDEIFRDMGSDTNKSDITLLPWSRAYKIVSTQTNTCLFTMVKSEEREPLFKWVGPIVSAPIVLLAKKSKNIEINTLDDLNKYKVVVIRNDIGHRLLVNRGIPEKSLFITTFPNKVPLLLQNDRVDIWAYGELSAFDIMNRNSINKSEYEVIYTLSVGENYYAFNLETSDEIIRIFQESLDRVKADGRYQNISDSYIYFDTN